MTAPLRNHKTLRTLLLCALYAFVLLFFLSPDSYLYDTYFRSDSSWFFMCGKAWMHGMIPYVDFADSKGPLLWLIYGVGYLLNHHSQIGVFWITVLLYAVILFIAYKLCRLFLDEHLSAICVALLPFALLLRWVNLEAASSEDFCYAFVLFSLYALCRIIKEEESLPTKTFFWLCTGMGISFTACLLIKWNIGCMIGGIMLMTFILSFKQKRWALCLGSMIGGAVVLALPFLIYFLAFADFGTFIHEYFVNTFRTMDGRTNIMDTLTFDLAMIDREKFVIVLFIGMLLFTWRHKRYFWLLLCFLIFRLGLGKGTFRYISILMPYAVFFLIAFFSLLSTRQLRVFRRFAPAWCVLAAILTVTVNLLQWGIINRYLDREKALAFREKYYEVAYVMSQVEKPKVLWYSANDFDLGTMVDALPACRYWTRQIGATEEMFVEREQALREKIPDFVLLWCIVPPDETDQHERTTALGYVQYVVINNFDGHVDFALYGPPGLQLPPPDFHVSQWDVWLKRNIFGI